MMKKIFTVSCLMLSLLLLNQSARAQYVIKQADEEYLLFNYPKAVELYLKAYKQEPKFYTADRIANSYRLMRDYNNTEEWYAKVAAMREVKAEQILYYAEALRNNSKYAEARTQYNKYYGLKKDFSRKQLTTILASCDSAISWVKKPKPVEIITARTLNSTQSDWAPAKLHDGIVFASDRKNEAAEKQAGKHKPFLRFGGNKTPDVKEYDWTGNDYLRLYWLAKGADTVTLFPFSAGTDYHISSPTFTADGNEMYYTQTRVTTNWNKGKDTLKTFKPEIYSSKRDGASGKWSKPEPFKYNQSQKSSVGDPFITPDGKGLYYVSDMPGGVGGTDIYYCARRDDGTWALPVNLKEINSAGNERTPFLDSLNNLYFSSDDGIVMGGLDIFKSARNGDTFGPKQNLGYPFNSPRDDFSFILTDATSGYFASNREGSTGSDDIYSFTQKAVINLKLEGVVYDKSTNKPIAGSLVTLGNNKITTGADGSFNYTILQGPNYKLRGELSGYLSDNQLISTQNIGNVTVIHKDLYLDKIVLNKAIRIENIYYDFDKSDIRPDAAIELDKLIKILNDNPNISIELGSHTDSRGNDDYNQSLSQRRANSAVNYSIDHGGIDEERIIARGYGESQLLNRCANGVKCSDAEHQLNRRTEFKIIKQ